MADRDLRIAVVGAGMMGGDHIARIAHRISGAIVAVIVEPDRARADAAAANAQGAAVRADIRDALDARRPRRRPDRHARPVPRAGAAALPRGRRGDLLREAAHPGQRVVAAASWMRNSGSTGPASRSASCAGSTPSTSRSASSSLRGILGHSCCMHCAHRNPSTSPGYTEAMLITDSVVHEFDSVPWLAGERIVSVEVKRPLRNSLAPAGLDEPQLVFIELESGAIAIVEINVNAQFGYQVTAEAVMERGVAAIGRTAGLQTWRDARWGGTEHTTFKTRFGAAFDTQVQRWVDAVHRKEIDGASAWDGYLAAAACEAGVAAQRTGQRVEVTTVARPVFYASREVAVR